MTIPKIISLARRRRGGFTLVEVLVTVAIITTLLAVLMPALSSVRAAGDRVGEMAAARQLMLAYQSYTIDHRDAVMPGFLRGLPVRDYRGLPVTGESAARYPWRIVEYLDFTVEGLFNGAHRQRLERMRQEDPDGFIYGVSLGPSLGLNATWVGGNQIGGEMGFDKTLLGVYGRFYVTSMGEVRHPARLMVFTSARGDDPLASGLGPVEGYFRTSSPFLTAAAGDRWAESFDRGDRPLDFGFVSPRHEGQAVATFIDGHVDLLTETELRDMRHWSNRADGPEYGLVPRP